MKTQPLVTVGVPTYNRPKGLKRALNSLVNQTYQNLEIIVSDNCSSDKEVQNVINEFKSDERVVFFRQPVNKGLINNFNFLVIKATGDYFMWLADDDWLDLNYVENCLKYLLEHPDYNAAYGFGKIHNLNEEFINYDLKIDLQQTSGNDRIKFFLKNVVTNGCFSALVPKSCKSELIMKDVIAADWLVVSRIAFLGKYKMLETTNTHISYGGVSSTTEGLTKHMSVFTKSFPNLNIALNIASDIIFGSKVYQKYNWYNRILFAKECFLIVFKRQDVRKELKPGIKKLISFKKQEIKFHISRFTKSKL